MIIFAAFLLTEYLAFMPNISKQGGLICTCCLVAKEVVIMTFEEFSELVLKRLEAAKPEFRFRINDTVKNNGVAVKSITIAPIETEGSMTVSPQVYLGSVYADYCENGRTIDDVVSKVLKILIEGMAVPFDLSVFKHKDRLFLQLVNKERNSKELEKYVHYDFGDFALVVRILYQDDGKDKGFSSAMLLKSFLDDFKLSEEELYNVALENTRKLFPFIEESLIEWFKKFGPQYDFPETFAEPGLIVLSNDRMIYGATVIVYPETKEFIKSLPGYKYLIPSSIHEWLLLSSATEYPVEEIRDMVVEVNKTQVAPAEFLADCVYALDEESGCIYEME